MADAPEFKVRITGDASGLQQAGRESEAALGNITKETKKSSEANIEHSKSFVHAESSGRSFHRLIHQITEDSPALGAALQLALNPVSGSIIAATLLFRELNRQIEESNKRADEMAAAFARPMGDMKKAISEAIDEIHAADVAYDDWAKHLNERTGEIQTQLDLDIAKLKAEAEAVKQSVADKKEALLEELRLQKEVGTITAEQYESRKRRIEGGAFSATQSIAGTAGQAEINLIAKALLDTTAVLKTTAAQTDAAQAAATDPNRALRLKALPGELVENEKLRKDYEKWIAEIQEEIEAVKRRVGPGQSDPEVASLMEELDRLQHGEFLAQRFGERGQTNLSRLTQDQKDAAEAQQRLRSQTDALTKQFETLSIKLDSLQTKFGIEESSRVTSAQLKDRALNAQVLADLAGRGIGGIVMPGAEAYAAQQRGEELSRNQTAALQGLTALLTQLGENNRRVLDSLAAAVGNGRAMADRLTRIETDIQNWRTNSSTRILPGAG
jgi:hypothetical protein